MSFLFQASKIKKNKSRLIQLSKLNEKSLTSKNLLDVYVLDQHSCKTTINQI